ncbi:hypothetical protein [Agrococcus baldri]|nr:hypothetical protein [Agrococcus baldri]
MAGTGDVRIVGGSYVPRQIAQARKESGSDSWLWVALMAEPENPFAPNTAVRADLIVNGLAYKCGYLSSEASDDVRSAVYEMRRRGSVPVFPGKIWRGQDPTALSVYAWIAPGWCIAADPTRGAARIFLPERDTAVTAQVTRQRRVGQSPDGTQARLFELSPTTGDQRTLGVFCDGEECGRLTELMSERFSPHVRAARLDGRAAMAYGSWRVDRGDNPKLSILMPSYSVLDKGWSPWLYHKPSAIWRESLVLA